MKIYVWKNNLYLVGTFKEILSALKELSKDHITVKEVINRYLH